MPTRPVPDTSWGKTSCWDLLPRALVLTLFAMFAHAPAMWRYLRKGDLP